MLSSIRFGLPQGLERVSLKNRAYYFAGESKNDAETKRFRLLRLPEATHPRALHLKNAFIAGKNFMEHSLHPVKHFCENGGTLKQLLCLPLYFLMGVVSPVLLAIGFIRGLLHRPSALGILTQPSLQESKPD